MLKILQNPNNILETTCYTKCAEIHYLTSNFNIVCDMCRETYPEYQQFLQHFRDMHFVNFMQNLYGQSDPIFKEIQGDKTSTQKCVKQELLELADQVQHQEGIVKASNMVEEIPQPKSIANHINITDIENVTYETEKKSSQIDWPLIRSSTYHKLNEKRPYKPRNQSNSCSYCGKIFSRRYQLDTHLNIHTGLKPHQCDVCGRQFRAGTTLQRHLNTHGKRQTYTCQYCSKEFTHRAALVSHETRHTQERCVPCEYCSKMFYTQNQLDTHKRKLHNKTDDLSLPHACNICPKRYRSASMLSTHKFKKHYKMAKFGCEQCDKKFVDQSQLNIHINTIHFKNC